jgi:hypothetical protein
MSRPWRIEFKDTVPQFQSSGAFRKRHKYDLNLPQPGRLSMALFLNAQGRAEFFVQILCLLMNRRAFQTFDVGCAGEKWKKRGTGKKRG